MHHVLITTTYQDRADSPVGISTVSVACEDADEALAVAQAINSEQTGARGIRHDARVLGLPVVTARDIELDDLREKVRALEALRPHWAQGYSSDGQAAQAATGALSSLWRMLDAKSQTEAVQKLRALIGKRGSLDAAFLEEYDRIGKPTDDEALVMEAYDFAQFSVGSLTAALPPTLALALNRMIGEALRGTVRS